MSPSMAGATIKDQRLVSSMVDRTSSASPTAALARKLAVAGATTMASALQGWTDVHLLMSFEEVGRSPPAGQHFKSHRRDELGRSPGHHDGDPGPCRVRARRRLTAL